MKFVKKCFSSQLLFCSIIISFSFNTSHNKKECKTIETDYNSIVKVCIDKAKEADIPLSDLIDSYKQVQLDNKSKAFLNRPLYFAASKNYILICDALNQPAKLFSANGSFICELGKIGRGPKDYATVISPYIDEKQNQFWLLRGGNMEHGKDGTFLVFDVNGKVIREIETSTFNTDIRNNNRVVVHNNQMVLAGNVSSPHILSYQNLETQEITHIKPRIDTDHFVYTTNRSTLYPRNNEYVFKVGEADTIYSFNPESKKVKPEAVIYTEKHKFDKEKIQAARNSDGSDRWNQIVKATEGGYSIRLAGETKKDYLLFVSIQGKQPTKKLLIINKMNQTAVFANLINDFGSGETISPRQLHFYLNKFLIVHQPQIKSDLENDKVLVGILK